MLPSLAKFKVDDPEELFRDLRQLDALPVRTADTVTVFYVKAGQNKLADILQNVVSRVRFKYTQLALPVEKIAQDTVVLVHRLLYECASV
jgi:hypothetical protein